LRQTKQTRHPDAVLTSTIARKRLQAVAGWCPQVVQGAGIMELQKLPIADPEDISRHALHEETRPSGPRGFVLERPDHPSRY
jgi:hypothetical protein